MDFKVPGPATHTFFSTFHLDDTCMFSQNILEKNSFLSTEGRRSYRFWSKLCQNFYYYYCSSSSDSSIDKTILKISYSYL